MAAVISETFNLRLNNPSESTEKVELHVVTAFVSLAAQLCGAADSTLNTSWENGFVPPQRTADCDSEWTRNGDGSCSSVRRFPLDSPAAKREFSYATTRSHQTRRSPQIYFLPLTEFHSEMVHTNYKFAENTK